MYRRSGTRATIADRPVRCQARARTGSGELKRLQVESLSTAQLQPASFTLAPGECAGISGSSGAGKTLLLRALADLDPHSGEVYLDGVAADRIPAPVWRRRVGLLPAESAWWGGRVRDHFRADPGTDLERVGLPQTALDWEVRRLSTGERQRLALLRLLENRPEVLLLDEPTANLDETGRMSVEALIGDYRARCGASVVWVTHDSGQLARVAGVRMYMEQGRLHAPEEAQCT